MKKKLLSLALALTLCLGLTVPALAYDYVNGRCTYELSNDIIGTVELPYPDRETGETVTMTAYVVPDNTTVRPKNAPGARVASSNYIFGDWVAGGYMYEPGEPVVVEPSMGEDVEDSWWAYAVWTEDTSAEGYDPSPDAFPVAYLDMDEGKAGNGSFRFMAESAAKALGLTIQPYTDDPAAFDDVKKDDWFYDPVQWAVEQSITNGTSETTFSPYDTCTQAQILTFLWRAAGSPESTAALPFGVENGWAETALCWAYEKGLIEADFEEDAPCERQDVVLYLWILAGNPNVSDNVPFTDVPAGMALYVAVSWAVTEGITAGTSETTFSPNDTCTRGQIVTFLYRAFAQ